jgi:hypothetical protein
MTGQIMSAQTLMLELILIEMIPSGPISAQMPVMLLDL